LAILPTPDCSGRNCPRHAAGAHFGHQEIGHVPADGFGSRGWFVEAVDFVLEVGFDDAHDLGRVHRRQRRADAVRSAVDGDLAAQRRIEGLVDIVHA
jgi:hypothetical protein